MLFHKPISYILFHTKQGISTIIFNLLQICPPQIRILLKLENTIFFFIVIYGMATRWRFDVRRWIEWSWDAHAAACDPIIPNHARVVYFLSEGLGSKFWKIILFSFPFWGVRFAFCHAEGEMLWELVKELHF